MATFSETRGLISRKYAAEQGIVMPNLYSRTRQEHSKLIRETRNFSVAFLRFRFTKTTVKSKFSEFYLPLRDPLVATFIETPAPTSRKYVVEQGIVMPN